MALDFSTTAEQALTKRHGHTDRKTWTTTRSFPSGPVKVHLTDVTIGQYTNVGFIDRTFAFASYSIGIERIGPGPTVGLLGIVTIIKNWGVDPGWRTILANAPAGNYRMVTQLNYARQPGDTDFDISLPAVGRSAFRVIAG